MPYKLAIDSNPGIIELAPPRHPPKELILIHAILECLAAVNKDDGHLIVVLPPQLRVTIDVDLMPHKFSLTLGDLERLFDNVAEMTSGTRVDHHFVHGMILCAARY